MSTTITPTLKGNLIHFASMARAGRGTAMAYSAIRIVGSFTALMLLVDLWSATAVALEQPAKFDVRQHISSTTR